MRALIVLCLCIITSLPAHAQDAAYFGPYAFEKNSRQYIFSDSPNLRSAPAASAAIVNNRLPAGTPVTILAQKQVMESGFKRAPWYYISFRDEQGATKQAYIWGGLLALGAIKENDLLFAYNIEGKFRQKPVNDNDQYKMDESNAVCIGLHAFRNGQLIATDFYNVLSESLNAHGMQREQHHHLPRTKSMFSITFSGEACGIPSFTDYVVWDGGDFILLPQLTSVGDAGVFGYEETFIFPDMNSGSPGKLIRRQTSTEYGEEDASGNQPEKTTVEEVHFTFNAETKIWSRRRMK